VHDLPGTVHRRIQPAVIAGDARKNFRWLQMFEKYPVADLVWLDAEGKPRTVPAKPGSKFPLGAPSLPNCPMPARTRDAAISARSCS
jgi:hypothetical protein